MTEDFEKNISNAIGSLAAGGSVPAGGAAAAQAGAAQRRRRGAVLTTMAAIVLLFGGILGATQLLDDSPATSEFATEGADGTVDGDGTTGDPADDPGVVEATPTPEPTPTVAPAPTTAPNQPICAEGLVYIEAVDSEQCVPEFDLAPATPTPVTVGTGTSDEDPVQPQPTPTPGGTQPQPTPTPTTPTTPTLPPPPTPTVTPSVTPTATPPTGSVAISGTVTSSSGAAISNAQISLSGTGAGVAISTDSNGNYLLSVAPGDYVMGIFLLQPASFGGNSSSILVHSQQFTVSADLVKDIVVQAPMTVNVTVLDSDGTPSAFADVAMSGTVTSSHISGIDIAPLSSGLENQWGAEATANGAGQASLYPYAGVNTIAVNAAGVPSFNVPWDGVSTNITVNVPAGVIVTGTVALADGTPLSNVNVAFPGSAGVLTNSSGQYSVEVNPGTMGVQLQSMPPTSGYNEFLFTAQPRSITTSTTWDFTVANPTTLTVTVQDSLGNPLPNYSVTLSGGMESAYVPGTSVVDPSQDIDNGWYTNDITNGSGQATLRPYADDLSVAVTASDGSAPQYFPWDGISSTLTIQVVANPIVNGQIVKAGGGTFGFCSISFAIGGGAASCDSGGSFSLPIPNGTYTPTVEGYGTANYPDWIFQASPITVSGPQTLNITIAMPATLSVTVLDVNGNRVTGAGVTLRGEMTNSFVTGLVIDPNNLGADNGWFTSGMSDTSGSVTVYPFQTAGTIEVLAFEGVQQQDFLWDGVSTSVTVQLV